MSISALLKGVEKRLRSEDVFDDQPEETVGRYFGIHPNPGIPPRGFGQWYASIHWGGGQGRDRNPQRHDAFHGVIVTLTARLNYAPRDRQGIRLATANDVYDLADRIAAPNIVHGNWSVVNYANEFIVGTAAWAAIQDPPESATVNGFTETLVLGPMGPERPAPPGWVSEDAAKDVYVIDIRFADARRIQANY
jgi:hypothetical protein